MKKKLESVIKVERIPMRKQNAAKFMWYDSVL
jgi:hypothetical protein